MKNILITGGAGFIGSHLTEELCDNYNIIVVDNLSVGKLINLKDFFHKITFINIDLHNHNLRHEIPDDIDLIIHLAAIPSVEMSIKNPIDSHKQNFTTTLILLELMREKKIKNIIFSSSAAVYQDNGEEKNENSITDVSSLYGLDKIYCENLIELYSKKYSINYTIFRFFNVYGSRQNCKSAYSGVINKFINMVKNDEQVCIYDDGEQMRDFVFVKDIAKITHAFIKFGKLDNEKYNIGTACSRSINSLHAIICDILNKKSNIIYKEKRQEEIRNSFCDNRKLLNKINFKFTSLEEGIKSLE